MYSPPSFFWCEFAGAFTTAETALFSGVGTEGAEQGMDMIWAAKALEIVRTTCNRAIYVLMEAPAYGYSTGTQAKWVMAKSSSFYDGSECPCASHTVGGVTTNECRNTALYPVTISNRGWLPPAGGGTPTFPVENGAAVNGVVTAYSADSTSPLSPWFESMVFPENPSGRIKTGKLPVNRRVCDGVYLFPQYFGMTSYSIPIAQKPDCSAWSFSVTKVFNAAARAGVVLYKTAEADMASAVGTIASDLSSFSHGLWSEWSWFGQMQVNSKQAQHSTATPSSH